MGEPKDKPFEDIVESTVAERANSLTFDDKVVRKITGFAISEVRGIIPVGGSFITGILRSSEDLTKGISVDVIDRKVTVDLKVICEYGQNIPKIFRNLVDKLTEVVKEMTGLDVVNVNVHVFDVLTKEEFERQSRKRIEEKFDFKESIPEIPFRILDQEYDKSSELDVEDDQDFDFRSDEYSDMDFESEIEPEPDLDEFEDMVDFTEEEIHFPVIDLETDESDTIKF